MSLYNLTSLIYNMWFKQAASSMWNATKNILADTRTPSKKLMDEIVQSSEEIIPTNKLAELASLTYDLQSFQQIVQIAIERIRVFKYDIEQARRNLNMLITINYLIKHGATAFVDELREYIPTFKKYQSLEELKTYEDEILQNKLNYELQKIKSRANHIQTLLEDKQKLLKEKELSMLVKQKLRIYEKSRIQDIKDSKPMPNEVRGEVGKKESKISEAETQARLGNMEAMLEKYLWRYVDKLDGKIEQISDKVLEKVDKYVLGELPDQFQLEDDESDDDKEHPSQPTSNYKQLKDDKEDQLLKRLEQQGGQIGGGGNSNLLQFQQVVEQQIKKPSKPQNDDLI